MKFKSLKMQKEVERKKLDIAGMKKLQNRFSLHAIMAV